MYIGMTFNTYMSGQKAEDSVYSDDAHAALAGANEQWEKENMETSNYPRLLVVKEQDEKETRIAFFEFSSFNTCLAFVNSKKGIVFFYGRRTDLEWRAKAYVPINEMHPTAIPMDAFVRTPNGRPYIYNLHTKTPARFCLAGVHLFLYRYCSK